MALRMIEICLPRSESESVKDILEKYESSLFWHGDAPREGILIKFLLPVEETEVLSDLFEKRYKSTEGFRMVFLPVEAAVPRLGEDEDAPAEKKNSLRVSREELYHDVSEACQINALYLWLTVLSALVASIGLLKGSLATVIGAMMIAPLLGPNVALSLAVTLGDLALARRAILVNLAGVGSALLVAVVIGYVFRAFFAELPEMLMIRTGLEDIVLALSAGAAGALSFTTGIPATLIGVMIAVALLPPLVSAGILLGAGLPGAAVQAFLLVAINVICLNLAGVLTFHLQEVRPLTWWEEGRAEKASRAALGLLSVLLFLLALIIFWYRG